MHQSISLTHKPGKPLDRHAKLCTQRFYGQQGAPALCVELGQGIYRWDVSLVHLPLKRWAYAFDVGQGRTQYVFATITCT
jgi:hypothetical protein